MNKQLTEIAYILDRSGSMQSISEAAISGFNTFLQDQQNAPGDANLTLVLFDNEYLVPHQTVPIADFPELTARTFVPRGSTSLLDAVGKTIQATGERLAALPEAERPGHVVIAIFTDGYENSSTQFTLAEINQMITHQRNTYSWKFLFLAANQDAIATAAQMGISGHAAATISHDEQGTTSGSKAFSKSITASREMNFFEGRVCEHTKASLHDNLSDDAL